MCTFVYLMRAAFREPFGFLAAVVVYAVIKTLTNKASLLKGIVGLTEKAFSPKDKSDTDFGCL